MKISFKKAPFFTGAFFFCQRCLTSIMKIIIYPAITCICIFFGCNSQEKTPNTDVDVGRAFIKEIQENKFKDAEKFILKDETNLQYFDRFQEFFKRKSKAELEEYYNADIVVNEISNVNDSVTIINYSNSYKKEEKNKLKVVKVNGQWQVDLKYTFSGNL